ncbi:MAG: actin-like ATPase involved in cell morphogenesis [Nitrospinales bacterium]|jgi:actin-like ATPase involved in cell morphogenesis
MTDSSNPEFRKVSEIQQRLDILIEHVESRKEALEEEIQEHLHESLSNARDSMELIQENIAPKVEKAIHTKMEDIDRKMRRLNEDSLEAVREELKKATPEISQKILEDLDKLVAENTRFVKIEIINEIKEDLKKTIATSLTPLNEKLDRELPAVKILAYISMGLSALALLGVVWICIR